MINQEICNQTKSKGVNEMNREIKFRGKREDNGEWVYGYYVKANMDTHWIVQMNYLGQLLPHDTHEVLPETVGQYTGLKDKNGKEIYEGDIIQTEGYEREYDTWLIRWNNLCYECVELPWDEENEPPNCYDLAEFGIVEVIGNIHENKVAAKERNGEGDL